MKPDTWKGMGWSIAWRIISLVFAGLCIASFIGKKYDNFTTFWAAGIISWHLADHAEDKQ